MRLSYLIVAAFAVILVSAKPDKGKEKAKDKAKGRADNPGPSNSGQSNSNGYYIALAQEDLDQILLTNEYRNASSSNAGRSGRASSSRHGGQDDGEDKDARRGRKREEKKPKGLPRDPSERPWEFENTRNRLPGDEGWHEADYHITKDPNRPGTLVWQLTEGDGISRTESMDRRMGQFEYQRRSEQVNMEQLQAAEDRAAADIRDIHRRSAEIEALSRAGGPDSAVFSDPGEFTPGATSAIYAPSRSSSPSPQSGNLTAPPPPELEYPDQEAWAEEYPEQQTWAEEYPEQQPWAEEHPEQEDQGDYSASHETSNQPVEVLSSDGWYYGYDEVQGRTYQRHDDGRFEYLDPPRWSTTLPVGPALSAPTSTSMQHSLVSDGQDPDVDPPPRDADTEQLPTLSRDVDPPPRHPHPIHSRRQLDSNTHTDSLRSGCPDCST